LPARTSTRCEDADALAHALDQLALDPQLRWKFGKAGRELSSARFRVSVSAVWSRSIGACSQTA
jgi:glycosyltransferase involved in cell wall biosynthesis